MTPEELKELQEKAALWDSLGKPLMDVYGNPIKAVKMECELTKEGYLRVPETIVNTSNASSHIDVLKEESREMVELSKDGIIENNIKTFVYDGGIGKCFKCGSEPFGHFYLCQDCLEFNHSGNGNF